MIINTPGSTSASSPDIPIHFSDSDSSEQAPPSEEWEQSTTPMMEVPSPYDDEQEGETLRIDSPLDKKKEDPDDATDRMNQSEIQAIADAVREAREREKRRRG